MNSFPAAPALEPRLAKTHFRLALLTMTLASLLFCQVPMLASGSEVETVEDAAITSLVKASLLSHLLLNSRTQTSGGVVTLSGHADNIAEKDLGSELAIEIAGVKRVINNMVIPTALAGNEL